MVVVVGNVIVCTVGGDVRADMAEGCSDIAAGLGFFIGAADCKILGENVNLNGTFADGRLGDAVRLIVAEGLFDTALLVGCSVSVDTLSVVELSVDGALTEGLLDLLKIGNRVGCGFGDMFLGEFVYCPQPVG